MQQFVSSRLGGAAMVLVALLAVAGCSAPSWPSTEPTPEEVPFLGQRLTQGEIENWRSQAQAQRRGLEARALEERKACYQRFFVNNCLQDSRFRFLREDAVLRKQELELNRQERALSEIDRQLRIQQNLREHPGAAGH